MEPPPNEFIRRKRQLRAAFGPLPGLSDREHDSLAEGMISLIEAAEKMQKAIDRLHAGPHAPEELSEMLVDFALAVDDIGGPGPDVMETLFLVGRRLRGEPDED